MHEEQVKGRMPDLITQGRHDLIVSHRSALFVPFVPFVVIPGKPPAAEFRKRLNSSIRLLVFIRVHSWFAVLLRC